MNNCHPPWLKLKTQNKLQAWALAESTFLAWTDTICTKIHVEKGHPAFDGVCIFKKANKRIQPGVLEWFCEVSENAYVIPTKKYRLEGSWSANKTHPVYLVALPCLGSYIPPKKHEDS